MTLKDAVNLCRSCHRFAPFASTAETPSPRSSASSSIPESPGLDQALVVRSLAGHIVAGVASEEEETAFREFCEGLC